MAVMVVWAETEGAVVVARELPLRNVLVLRDVVLLTPPKADGGVVAVVEVPGIATDELESSSSWAETKSDRAAKTSDLASMLGLSLRESIEQYSICDRKMYWIPGAVFVEPILR